jgi:hypothetical protein
VIGKKNQCLDVETGSGHGPSEEWCDQTQGVAEGLGVSVETPGEFLRGNQGTQVSVNVSIPEELYRKAANIARQRHVSIDEIFAAAFLEQLAAWEPCNSMRQEAAVESFLTFLTKWRMPSPRNLAVSDCSMKVAATQKESAGWTDHFAV